MSSNSPLPCHIDRKLPDKIPTGSGPMEIVVGRSTKLDKELSKSHLESIRKNLPTFSLVDCQTSSECCSSLGEPDLELVYFYCHGRRDQQKQPYLEIGTADKISPADIGAWDSSLWPKNHWRKTAPLVFINGCHTTELTPDLLVNFVDDFVGNYGPESLALKPQYTRGSRARLQRCSLIISLGANPWAKR